jgi:hypothetical protein
MNEPVAASQENLTGATNTLTDKYFAYLQSCEDPDNDFTAKEYRRLIESERASEERRVKWREKNAAIDVQLKIFHGRDTTLEEKLVARDTLRQEHGFVLWPNSWNMLGGLIACTVLYCSYCVSLVSGRTGPPISHVSSI